LGTDKDAFQHVNANWQLHAYLLSTDGSIKISDVQEFALKHGINNSSLKILAQM